ncbi:hypothetical protein [Synechococcus sp. PROS-U-1]|uniref:hypothetical protein n=1 Tax=Synechococcus sp. PROS-U-1 TaxID=1400866 RepID=UPI002106CFC3|nr:hypothetical protein [Synechococcus sp. PROS-U-1]
MRTGCGKTIPSTVLTVNSKDASVPALSPTDNKPRDGIATSCGTVDADDVVPRKRPNQPDAELR